MCIRLDTSSTSNTGNPQQSVRSSMVCCYLLIFFSLHIISFVSFTISYIVHRACVSRRAPCTGKSRPIVQSAPGPHHHYNRSIVECEAYCLDVTIDDGFRQTIINIRRGFNNSAETIFHIFHSNRNNYACVDFYLTVVYRVLCVPFIPIVSPNLFRFSRTVRFLINI